MSAPHAVAFPRHVCDGLASYYETAPGVYQATPLGAPPPSNAAGYARLESLAALKGERLPLAVTTACTWSLAMPGRGVVIQADTAEGLRHLARQWLARLPGLTFPGTAEGWITTPDARGPLRVAYFAANRERARDGADSTEGGAR